MNGADLADLSEKTEQMLASPVVAEIERLAASDGYDANLSFNVGSFTIYVMTTIEHGEGLWTAHLDLAHDDGALTGDAAVTRAGEIYSEMMARKPAN